MELKKATRSDNIRFQLFAYTSKNSAATGYLPTEYLKSKIKAARTRQPVEKPQKCWTEITSQYLPNI